MQNKGVLIGGSILLLLLPVFVFALEIKYPELPRAPKIGGGTLLPEYILYIYYFAIAVSGFIALGALLYGGLRYLTAGASPGIKENARGYIRGSVLGIGILMLSYIILTTINPQLAIFKLEKPEAGLTKEQIELAKVKIPAEEATFQEVPMGTLIEIVLDPKRLEQFKKFLEDAEKKSKDLRDKANALRQETNQCSCSGLAPPACSLNVDICVSSGVCTGDVCDWDEINKKEQDLQKASDELKNFVEPQLPMLTAYAKDIANLYYASIFMKEGVGPTPYEQYLEFKQMGLEIGATVDAKFFTGVGGEQIKGRGNDPMNFYFDIYDNEEIFQELPIPSIDPGFPPILPPGPGGVCSLGAGACAPGNLKSVFGAAAENASQICRAESGENVWSLNEGCRSGNYDYSVGLFQINLWRTGRCPVGTWFAGRRDALSDNITTCPWPPNDMDLLQQCAFDHGWGNAQLNAQRAYSISGGGTNWCPWSTACPIYCGLCSDPASCP